jgi:hypothetical protein
MPVAHQDMNVIALNEGDMQEGVYGTSTLGLAVRTDHVAVQPWVACKLPGVGIHTGIFLYYLGLLMVDVCGMEGKI